MKKNNKHYHTTRLYRLNGLDLFFGVLVNIFHAILVSLFKIYPPYAVLTAILVALICGIILNRNNKYLPEDLGRYFILLMYLESLVWTNILAKFVPGQSPIEFTQLALFLAFWTTVFTYLPILGIFRTYFRYKKNVDSNKLFFRDFIVEYFKIHGLHLKFPLIILISSGIYFFIGIKISQSIFGLGDGIFSLAKDIQFFVLIGSMFLGFFSSLFIDWFQQKY